MDAEIGRRTVFEILHASGPSREAILAPSGIQGARIGLNKRVTRDPASLTQPEELLLMEKSLPWFDPDSQRPGPLFSLSIVWNDGAALFFRFT